MKRAVVHVGLAKTGTSTVQATLADNRAALSGIGVAYPGHSEAHHDLLALFHQQGARHFWYLNQRIDRHAAQAAAEALWCSVEEAARADVPVILLSSEYFQNFRVPQFRALDARFAALGYRMQTLCYIREPMEHTASRIQQAVRMGTFRLPELMERPYQPQALNHAHAAIVALGRRRVQVRRLSDVAGDGLTRDVLGRCGADPALDQNPDGFADLTRNVGLCRDAVYALDAVNAVDDDRRRLAQRCLPALEAMCGPKFTLPPDMAARIIAESRAEQEWLYRKFGFCFPPPRLPDGPDYVDLMAEGAARAEAFNRKYRGAQGWLRRAQERSA